jgi:hypothetical protein
MAKATAEKKYITFVKGLITEADALTFPENASLDEDNFDLNRDGSRERRLGIDYESGYVETATGIADAILQGSFQSFHKWDFPGGSSTVSIGIVRAYNKLWFIDILAATPSATLLNGGASITIAGLANSDIQTTTINNYFIIVSQDLEYPVVLKYDPITDTVTQDTYPIQVRDFWGVEDSLDVTERPATLSATHEYNLRNQGWNDDITSICAASTTTYVRKRYHSSAGNHWRTIATTTYNLVGAIACTFTKLGAYPSNSDVWSLGKVGAFTADGAAAGSNIEKYDPDLMKRNQIDRAHAPKGSMVLDAFARGISRSTITALTGLPSDDEQGRITTITTYAGRVFYAGVTSSIIDSDLYSPNMTGYIFFSQTVVGEDKLGKCFQENDPTSDTISDIVDTDGGTIYLPEATQIVKLIQVKDSIIVFAENGIWEIYGNTGGFKATDFQIAKISSVGIENPRSVIVANNEVYCWSKAGIFFLTQNPQTGRYIPNSLSINTIQTFFNNIPDEGKKFAKGMYDEKENHIRWLYNDASDYSSTNYPSHYTKHLNYDLTLKAFYKFSISSLTTGSPYIVDFFPIPNHALTTSTADIYDSSYTQIAVTNGDTVVVPASVAVARNETYNLLTFTGASFTLSKYKNSLFRDWITADTIGADFSSYLVTGFDTFQDVMRSKQVPYIFFYLNRTETGFVLSGTDLVSINPSSCLVQAQWNWSNSSSGGKWGTPFQAYRYVRRYIPSGTSDTYDTGDSIIVTKNKLRGAGKALSLKIYSETGKDLQLLGWALIVSGTGTP